MNFLYKSIYIVSVCFVVIPTPILANSLPQDAPIHYELGHASIIQHVTILPPEQTATDNVFPNYVFMDPATKMVVVQPQPHQFTKEATTFKSHRLHYIAFWGLFFLMRGTQWGK